VDTNDRNNPSITQLEIKGDNDIRAYNLDKIEMNIKRGMLDDTIPDDPQKRTATEINERIKELNLNLTSVFGRIIIDFLYPLVKRMIETIQTFGMVEQFDTSMIDGYGFRIQIKTPLARQNKTNELNDIISGIQLLIQMDSTLGLLKRHLKLDVSIPYILQLVGMPPGHVRNAEEISQYDQQQAEAAQAMQNKAVNDEITVNNAKEQAKSEVKYGY
jgi:hypothetical protein